MDSTLQALAGLAIKAIPTAIFFIFLTHFLKRVYFVPVAKILEERRQQTEGMKDLAKRAHEAADRKGSEFDAAIRLIHTQILEENEAQRRKWAEAQAHTLAEARAGAEAQIAAARADIGRQLESAKTDAAAMADRLGAQIEDSVLKRRAA